MRNFRDSASKKTGIIVFLLFFISSAITAQWTNYQNAAMVIGQADFVTGTYGTTATTVGQTVGVAVDNTNGKLYVADKGNHRILRYAISTLATGAAAERVFGQANLTSGSANRGGSCAQNSLNNPCGIAVDASGRLWVADADNNRVVWYNAAHSAGSDGPNANGVLGQTNYTNTSTGTTASTFNTVNQLSYLTVSSGGALYFSDINNNRVLRFDGASSLTPGVNNANGVLGQADFTHSGNGTTSTTLNYPSGLTIFGTTMFVADQQNNRVLRFDNPVAAANGQAANGVLGQADFTHGSLGTTQSTMNLPSDVSMDGAGRLYVADINNMRTLIFNSAAGLANGANADNELGQVNFTTRVQSITQPGYWYPYAVHANGGHLYVSDGGGARVLRYDPTSTLPVKLLSFSGTKENKKVELNWSTASEINSDYFQIMRSSDGIHFEKIAKEDALGNSSILRNYTIIDDSPAAGVNYYKLVEYDRDGATQESKVVSVNYENDLDLIIQTYPNPSAGKTVLYFNSAKGGMYSLSVSNINGDMLYLARIMGIPGENKFTLSLEDLSSGQYFINLISPDQKLSTHKFVKE
jgi:hypothetical protein